MITETEILIQLDYKNHDFVLIQFSNPKIIGYICKKCNYTCRTHNDIIDKYLELNAKLNSNERIKTWKLISEFSSCEEITMQKVLG